MEVISEQFRQYDIWCRPLGRSRYTFSEMRKKKLPGDSDGSTALLRAFREMERQKIEQSGVLSGGRTAIQHDEAYEEYTSALSTTSESYAAILNKEEEINRLEADIETPVIPAAPVPEPRLKRLRAKISDAVFDYSEIEQERLEQEIDQLVNADGYYNEVEPIDIDVEYEKERRITKPLIIAIVLFIAYIIYILKS